MRAALTLCVFLALILPVSISCSSLPVNFEGSGNEVDELDSEDWSVQVSPGKTKSVPAQPQISETTNTFHTYTVNFNRSEYVIVESSKSFSENKEIFAAVIAGGVIGVALAVVLAGLLLYTKQRRDHGGYVLGHQRASDRDPPNSVCLKST